MLFIIFPLFLSAGLVRLIIGSPEEGTFAFNAISYFLLVQLYFLGVIAAYRHVVWRKKNISHLINK